MKKINKEYLILAILGIITIIITWYFIQGFNSYDTYKMHSMGYVEYAKQLFFADGRIFSGIYILMANFFNIFETDLYRISIILCIPILIANVAYFKNLLTTISNKKLNLYLIYILSFITIFNFTYVDNMRFIEMPIIALSIFLYMVSAKKAVIDKSIVKTIFTLLIAVFMYQGTINVFFIITLFLLLNKHKTLNRNVIKEYLKIILFSIIPIIINYVYMKIYGCLLVYTNREFINFSIIPQKFVKSILTLINVLIYTKGIMPENFYFLIILMTISLTYLLILKNKGKYFNTYLNIIILIIMSFISCLPIIIGFNIDDMNDAFGCGRLFWAIGAIFGLIMIQLYLNTNIIENKWYRKLIYIVIVIYSVICYTGMHSIMQQSKLTNDIDKNICETIKENIENYESNTDYKVERLKVRVECSGEGISKRYENTRIKQSYILLSLPIEPFLEFYTGLHIENHQYISENVIEFNKDLDFYYVENTCYLYMNF